MAAVSGSPVLPGQASPYTNCSNGTFTDVNGVKRDGYGYCPTQLRSEDTRAMTSRKGRRKEKASITGLSAWIVGHQICESMVEISMSRNTNQLTGNSSCYQHSSCTRHSPSMVSSSEDLYTEVLRAIILSAPIGRVFAGDR